MRYAHLILSITLLAMPPAPLAAATAPLNTMAEIVIHMNHYPSESEIATLQVIVDDSHLSRAEHVLAAAVMHFRHRVAGPDLLKLGTLKHNKSATVAEREFADILMDVHHHPSEQAIARLKALMR